MLSALAMALAAAAGPSESITVNADALVGAWKLTRPSYIAKRSVFGAIEFGPPAPGFCRVEQAKGELAFHCLHHGSGTVSLEGRKIRFAWGTMLARMAMDGDLQSDNSFSGHVMFNLAGITAADTNLSAGGKLDLSAAPADESDKVKLLKAAIAWGDKFPLLGGIQTVILLGNQDRFSRPDQPDNRNYFTVFAVEFERGECICGLHQSDDGGLDAFQCV